MESKTVTTEAQQCHDAAKIILEKMQSERPTILDYLTSRATGEARSSVEWRGEDTDFVESLKTRTTRYKGEDGRERAVILWNDYEALLRLPGQQSAYRAGSSNAYLDVQRMIERGGFLPT